MQFFLRWTSESKVSELNEPDDFALETRGKIYVQQDRPSQDDESPVLAGSFKTMYADIEGALNANQRLFDLFERTPDLEDFCPGILDIADANFSCTTHDLIEDETFSLNFMVVTSLKILPEFRSSGVGLSILEHLVRRFGPGAAVVALHVRPLQFVSHERSQEPEIDRLMGYEELSKEKRTATESLARYYEKAGFKRVPDSPFMIRSLARTT